MRGRYLIFIFGRLRNAQHKASNIAEKISALVPVKLGPQHFFEHPVLFWNFFQLDLQGAIGKIRPDSHVLDPVEKHRTLYGQRNLFQDPCIASGQNARRRLPAGKLRRSTMTADRTDYPVQQPGCWLPEKSNRVPLLADCATGSHSGRPVAVRFAQRCSWPCRVRRRS